MRNREALDAAVEEIRAKGDHVVAGLSERADSVEGEDLTVEDAPDLGSLVIDQGVDE